MKSAPVRTCPLPWVPPPAKSSSEITPPRPKGVTIQSKLSSSEFSWETSTNLVVILIILGVPPRISSTSWSTRSRFCGVLLTMSVEVLAIYWAEDPGGKSMPASLRISRRGRRGASERLPRPSSAAKGSTSPPPSPSPPPVPMSLRKVGGTFHLRVRTSSPSAEPIGRRVTAKSSTL